MNLSWLGLSLLFASPLAGGLLVMAVKPHLTKPLKMLLTFCGGFLFATAVLHLLPEVFATQHHYEGLLILVGFFLQMLLEKFSEGVEHGHLHLEGHAGHDHGPHDHSHFHKHGLSFGLLLSLSIHSLVEGIPLNGSFSIDQPFWQNPLLFGVIIHKFPSAFALMTVLRQSALNNTQRLGMLLFFCTHDSSRRFAWTFYFGGRARTNQRNLPCAFGFGNRFFSPNCHHHFI